MTISDHAFKLAAQEAREYLTRWYAIGPTPQTAAERETKRRLNVMAERSMRLTADGPPQ
jgi:hypothetical protein